MIDQGGTGDQGLSTVTGAPVSGATNDPVSDVLSNITGSDVFGGPSVGAGQLYNLYHQGHAIVVGTVSTGNDNSDHSGSLIDRHEYVVQNVSPDGTVTLRNPWNPNDTVTRPWSQLQSQLSEVKWTNGKP